MSSNADDRWWHIDAVFSQALDVAESERSEFLDRACSGKPTLRRQIEQLLDAHRQAEAFLEDPGEWFDAPVLPGLDPPDATAVTPPEEAEQQIGAYRLLKVLGRGGMGTVYLAERADGQFRQRVALKLILQGRTGPEAVRRFRMERQILARLQHPHIAFLIDGGITDKRLPYFVMEFVDGVPLDQYCDQNGFDIEARIRLFLTICEALQYAHQNLVVHRDLKPSNILVNSSGEVKLLDFGIAKLMDNAEVDMTLPVTASGHPIMTLAYAAPEQVTDQGISTATDIYALGVILYRLLTGCHPYEIKGRTAFEISKSIQFTVPEKPSLRIGSADENGTAPQAPILQEKWRNQLRGDLDAIVMKAVKKEPHLRYGSVGELAEDLRRYLHHLPVQARDDTVRYRVSKFVRRHKATVTAGISAVMILIIGIIAFAWQADAARQEALKATAALDFILASFDELNPAQAGAQSIAARDLVISSLAHLEDLEAQPLVQASIMNAIGQLCSSVALHEEADSLHSEALEIRRRLLGNNHPDVAESLMGIGISLRNRGKYQEAQIHFESALEIRKAVIGETDERTIESYILSAFGYYMQGKPSIAIERYEYIFPLLDRSFEGRKLQEFKSRALYGYASSFYALGDLVKAESLYRETLQIQKRLFGDDHLSVSHTLSNLANCLFDLNRLPEADTLYQETLQLHLKLYGEEHQLTGNIYYGLGRLNHRMKKTEEAERFYTKAIQSYDSSLGRKHRWTARPFIGLGGLYLDSGRPRDAAHSLRSSLAIFEASAVPDTNSHYSRARLLLGQALMQLGQHQEPISLESK